MPDKSIFCAGCGQEFVFSEAEQAFFKEKGLMNTPKRCRACRQTKRVKRGEDPGAVWKEPTGRKGGPT